MLKPKNNDNALVVDFAGVAGAGGAGGAAAVAGASRQEEEEEEEDEEAAGWRRRRAMEMAAKWKEHDKRKNAVGVISHMWQRHMDNRYEGLSFIDDPNHDQLLEKAAAKVREGPIDVAQADLHAIDRGAEVRKEASQAVAASQAAAGAGAGTATASKAAPPPPVSLPEAQAASKSQIFNVPVPDLKSPKEILEEQRQAQLERLSQQPSNLQPETGISHPLPYKSEESGFDAFKHAHGIGPSQVGIEFAGKEGSPVIKKNAAATNSRAAPTDPAKQRVSILQRVPLERVQESGVGAMPVPKPKRELSEAEQREAEALAAIEAEEIAASERLRAKKAERLANPGSSGSHKPMGRPPPAVSPHPTVSRPVMRHHRPAAALNQSGTSTNRPPILAQVQMGDFKFPPNVSSPPSAKPSAGGDAPSTLDNHAQALAAIEREEIAENERLMARRASTAAARALVGTPISPTISKGDEPGAISAENRAAGAEARFAALPQELRDAMSKKPPPSGLLPSTSATTRLTKAGHAHVSFKDPSLKLHELKELEKADPKRSGFVGGRSYSTHGASTSRKMKPQIGGADTEYELPPGSHLYNKFVTSFYPISSLEFKNEYPDFDPQVKAGIINGTIPSLTKREENEEQTPEDEEPSDNLSPAEQSSNNPEVIKNLIRSLNIPSKAETTKQYEELVKMCDKTTAVELIKQLLLSNSIRGKKPTDERMPTDERILEILGWNKNTNKLLYRNNGQGLFSLFCFDSGSFSPAFSRHCGENYVCMLNWVLILAFRLRIRDPAKYTDAAIEELIKNMHHALYGLFETGSMADNFTRIDANPNFYTDMSKKIMISKVMFDQTLKQLRRGIKAQVKQIPETKNPKTTTLDPEDQNNTLRNKTLRNNTTIRRVNFGGLRADSKNSTRKLHRHDRVRPMSHTIKITHKSNSNTKKTVSKRNN